MASYFIAVGTFDLFAVRYFTNKDVSYCFERPSRLSARHFKALFHYSSTEIQTLWNELNERARELKGALPFKPEHLLFGMYYLKVYPTWDLMAMTTGITEKTLRKWVGMVINHLAEIDNLVSDRRVDLYSCIRTVQVLSFISIWLSQNHLFAA